MKNYPKYQDVRVTNFLTSFVIIICLCLAMFSMPAYAAAPTPEQVAKLTANVAPASRWSVAVHEDTAVIGANADDHTGLYSGSAYVFVRDAAGIWSQQAKLTANNPDAYDNIGKSLHKNVKNEVIGKRLSIFQHHYGQKS